MNKQDVVEKVSEISKVSINDCKKVIDALEKVLEDDLESSQGLLNAFDKFHKLINLFRKNK